MSNIDEIEAETLTLQRSSMFGSQFYLADYQSNFVNETHLGNEIQHNFNYINNTENENETKTEIDDIVIDLNPGNISSIKQKVTPETEEQVQQESPTTMMQISNALIAVVGISDYDSMPNLDCVLNDYKNIEHAFHNVRGYSIVTFDKNNKIIHKKIKDKTDDDKGNNNANKNDESNGDDDINVDTFAIEEKKNSSSVNTTPAPAIKNVTGKGEKQRKTDYKLRWIDSEIFDFNDKVLSILENRKYNYDCLIYFVSSHGQFGGIICDSEENKIPLISIFEQFNNQNCIQLRNKPKIYFIEACRGDMTTKRIVNSNYNYNSKSGIHIHKIVAIDDDYDHDEKFPQNMPVLLESKTDTIETQNNNNIAVLKNISDSIDNHNKFTSVDSKQEDLGKEKTISIDESISQPPVTNKNKNKFSNNVFSKYSYNREIYANTEGYAVVEPYSKGAYLIRSVTKAFVNDKIFFKDFDTIMIHTRNILLKLMGKTVECGAQVIDDRSNIPTKLFFKQAK